MVDLKLLRDAMAKLRTAQADVRYAGDIANMALNHGSWISFGEASAAIEQEIEKLREIAKNEEQARKE
jgi:hypothetical protein